jgi:hypothetical protein
MGFQASDCADFPKRQHFSVSRISFTRLPLHYLFQSSISSVGDAAHSFPPTGGLGLNCGIADAHNLAFKLAFVQHNVADASVLFTYTDERRSVADTYSRQSVKNGQQIFALLRSLNTAGVDDPEQVRRNMMIALADPVQRRKVDEGIKGQREHFDNVSIARHYNDTKKIKLTNISLGCILAMLMKPVSHILMPHITHPSSSPGPACHMIGSRSPASFQRRVKLHARPCLLNRSMSRM